MFFLSCVVLIVFCCSVVLGKPNCDAAILEKCNDNPYTYIYTYHKTIPETEEGLADMCKIQRINYNCSAKYFDDCVSNVKKGVIKVVLNALKNEIEERCDPASQAHADYFKYVPCINTAGEAVHRCARWALDGITFIAHNVSATKQIHTMCCYFPSFAECIDDALRSKCGPDAAKYGTNFLENYFRELVEIGCNSRTEECKEAAPIKKPEEFDVSKPAQPALSNMLLILDNVLKHYRG